MAWPTTSDPKTEFATLRMTASEAADIDAAASADGVSRSAFLRACAEREITRRQSAARRAAKQTGPAGADDD